METESETLLNDPVTDGHKPNKYQMVWYQTSSIYALANSQKRAAGKYHLFTSAS
jgi:hypothetical protein